jgi:hypothetical protein
VRLDLQGIGDPKMPEPISIAVASVWLGTAAFHACARQRSAFSSEARDLADRVAIVMQTTETSHVLFGRKATAISKLNGIADACAESNWDGNEANAINETAVQTAEAFIRAMPDEMPMPELAPDPDGSIELDWIASRQRMFTVSVGQSNRLAYAWLDGAAQGHAVDSFDGDAIPTRIRDCIETIIDHAKSAVRVA